MGISDERENINIPFCEDNSYEMMMEYERLERLEMEWTIDNLFFDEDTLKRDTPPPNPKIIYKRNFNCNKLRTK